MQTAPHPKCRTTPCSPLLPPNDGLGFGPRGSEGRVPRAEPSRKEEGGAWTPGPEGGGRAVGSHCGIPLWDGGLRVECGRGQGCWIPQWKRLAFLDPWCRSGLAWTQPPIPSGQSIPRAGGLSHLGWPHQSGGATSALPSLTQPGAPHADSAGNRPPKGWGPSGQRPGSQQRQVWGGSWGP